MCIAVELYSVDPEVSKETNQANLLALEQKYLKWLFSLPDKFRFNFALIAGAPIAGRTHTPETLVKISASFWETGKTHSDETRTKMSKSQQLVNRSGENHPLFGLTGANHPRFGKSHSDETRAKLSAPPPFFFSKKRLAPGRGWSSSTT